MVYCGKPSKGCSNCRARKIKCDQREPGCGQCEKREQECQGYRNLVDLMFRDESDHVIKRATNAKSRRKGPPPPPNPRPRFQSSGLYSLPPPSPARAPAAVSAAVSAPPKPSSAPRVKLPGLRIPDGPTRPVVAGRSASLHTTLGQSRRIWRDEPADFSDDREPSDIAAAADDDDGGDDRLPSPGDGTWPSTPMAAILYSLAPSFQERGTAFFFARYVSGDMMPLHQNYSFIFDIWKPLSMRPEHQLDGVMASMTAVGLAALSVLTSSPAMVDWARRSYGTALRLTNDALQDPEKALQDTTMLSILILGTYEMLTGRTLQAMQAWQDHINGAAALAIMRGTDQFHSKACIQMFLMLCQTILIRCMQRDEPMPESLVSLRNDLALLSEANAAVWRVQRPMYDTLGLRSEMKAGVLPDAEHVLEKMVSIENDFSDAVAELPASWGYRLATVGQPDPVVLGSQCHVYPSLQRATLWNDIRSFRILIHETILGHLFDMIRRRSSGSSGPLPDEHRAQLSRSIRMLEGLRNAVIASIPQHFGAVSYRDILFDRDRISPSSKLVARNQPYRLVSSPPSAVSSPPPSPPQPADLGGATLCNPTFAKTEEEAARRFMILGSASSTIILPLYRLGVSSSCTIQVKEYILDRLNAVHEQTGMAEARAVALMLCEAPVAWPWDMMFPSLRGAMEDTEDSLPTLV